MRSFIMYETPEYWSNDSMLHESGEEVCYLEDDDYFALIEVMGEVSVMFKGEHYRNPLDFPEELKDIFRKNKQYSTPDVDVRLNNWYELMVFQKTINEDGWSYICGDVVDWDTITKKELEDLCQEWINDYKK